MLGDSALDQSQLAHLHLNMAQIERIEAKADEWVAVVVDWIAKKVNEFVASDGVCLLGLSGGMITFGFSILATHLAALFKAAKSPLE